MRRSLRSLLPGILVLGFLASAPLAAVHHGKKPTTLDCSKCHLCAEPTEDNLCLKPCPRHEIGKGLSPDLGPDVVILDELEDLYVPVRFNHKIHATMAEMSGGCTTCHHYTPPNSPHPECKSCHPGEIQHEDLAQPGLKGAYHRLCLRCHTEWDKDTSCEVCHAKKAGGKLGGTATTVCEHSHYQPIKLRDVIVFKTSHAGGDEVPFHHKRHSTKYERHCTDCHQQESCSRCHIQGTEELHPMGDLSQTNLHDTCCRCHERKQCDQCHGRDPDDLFNHAETGWALRPYHAKLACDACHGTQGGKIRPPDPKCSTCHTGEAWTPGTFDHARVTGVALGETHAELDCESCHTEGVGSKPQCDTCHDDGRTYDPTKGFPKD